MSNILLFSGSNSSASINTEVIKYTATQLAGHQIELIDLRDYEPPMYSQDIEKASGVPEQIERLLNKMEWADTLILSTPEHNGMPPAFLKNILDWLSRVKMLKSMDVQYLEGKRALIMSVSPGKGGALKAREQVAKVIGYSNAEIVGEFSLPSFSDNFQDGQIVNAELSGRLDDLLKLL